MTQLALQIPQTGQPDSTEDPKVASNFTAIQAAVNGNIDSSNIAAGTGAALASGVALQLASAGTPRKVAFGTGSVTFSGTSFSNIVTVTHGLGATPQAVVATLWPGGTQGAFFEVASVGGTTFTIQGQQPGTSVGTASFSWIAIG